jgi:alpha-ketoglutarate-dependent taurine dioxygenase
MFRVNCLKMKEQLSNQALKNRNRLVEQTLMWCADTVNHIDSTFREMQKTIQTPPTNEKELVFIKEFINTANTVTKEELGELLKAAYKHYELLEKYSAVYKQEDLEFAFYQKMWPMTIGQVIQDGKQDIQT